MLRRLRRIFHAWRAERGDTLLTAAVFFLFAAILTLTLTFQGGASVADKLTQTIPFEFRYRNSFLFSPHYQAVPDDDPYLDEKEFSQRDLSGYFESLNWMLDGFDGLGADPGVSSYQYSLCLTCGIQYYSSDDSTPAEAGFTGASDRIFGAESLSFFEDNGLELLSNSNPDAWNADGIFVPDTFQVMDGSGVLQMADGGSLRLEKGASLFIPAGSQPGEITGHLRFLATDICQSL